MESWDSRGCACADDRLREPDGRLVRRWLERRDGWDPVGDQCLSDRAGGPARRGDVPDRERTGPPQQGCRPARSGPDADTPARPGRHQPGGRRRSASSGLGMAPSDQPHLQRGEGVLVRSPWRTPPVSRLARSCIIDALTDPSITQWSADCRPGDSCRAVVLAHGPACASGHGDREREREHGQPSPRPSTSASRPPAPRS